MYHNCVLYGVLKVLNLIHRLTYWKYTYYTINYNTKEVIESNKCAQEWMMTSLRILKRISRILINKYRFMIVINHYFLYFKNKM